MNIQSIKQRFGIIGNSFRLNRCVEIAMQVSDTDLSVLITGESGTGKEFFPQIIHHLSVRKHNGYIAVNCGAIPEGTIDSELFGHEKGSFTGAYESRKGYFDVADNGTIFLDEVGELPLSTQVRLLRVLESGEYIKVGSSKVQKTNVRVIAATNVNIIEAIQTGKFREDLYYRLNTVPIKVPPLQERGNDIYLLFRKFVADFSEKYKMPAIRLDAESQHILNNYRWSGNVRQLKNITEQICIIEEERHITGKILKKYLPEYSTNKLPVVYANSGGGGGVDAKTFSSEREILYKILFDMKSDMNELKQTVKKLISNNKTNNDFVEDKKQIIDSYGANKGEKIVSVDYNKIEIKNEENKIDKYENDGEIQDTEEIIEENLSLADKEKELIFKALDKHENKRKPAAKELGISERTLYRKLKEYDFKYDLS